MAVLYGVLNMQDLLGDRVTEIGVDRVDEAITQSVAEHNRQLESLMGLFVEKTTVHKTRFRTPATARLQPIDNAGRALPLKPFGHYDVAYPIQMGGGAWGFDYVTGQKITLGEIADVTNAMLDADMRWMRDHILAALFYKSTTNPWTFLDEQWGTLSVFGLANGDTVTYNFINGPDTQGTDDHLLFDATPDADTFNTIWNKLYEHPENSGDIIALVPTNLRPTVEAISTFYPIEDPDLRLADTVTYLNATLGTMVPGYIFGKCERVWCVEWKTLPDDYIVGVASGGPRALRMREDEEEQLRGFHQVAERNDHPWYERQYIRRAGFGAWNRVGAVIVKNAGSYTVPTGYTSPLG